ncbi:putative penicillin-binding protein 4* [Magnetospirillum gryphiswaldense MSR-1 v2]|uniref:Penicillin-binding protein 4 n=1 Tax=Magnetospirillum gryphiswaldense (strain DSM 6361 / JCM 21280 / NBRC 15271 / MSR-1) TaxID=431944 RepID=V6F030_MAGGM|nr:serine hydrolase domain-containing protein [Magnetospirillum gryphiswaldense]CDK98804.1 putative penicillin-binding protein 4* [Magnetospirillum gryphiswaldense MSR-1 v2]
MAFWRGLLSTSASVLTVMVASAAATSAAEPGRGQVFHSILQRYLDQEDLNGGVLLVSAPHHREVAALGFADDRTNTRITADSRFYVASVGKMVTATTALQLVEEGALSLDAPVLGLVGSVPDIAKLPNVGKANVEQLLNHSSGIADYLTDKFSEDFHANPTRLTAARVLPYAYKEKPPGQTGKVHEYSNSNYVLLGDIIAKADGGSFEESIRRRVLKRAGMDNTTVGADPKDRTLAHGYADLEETGENQDVSRYAWNSPLGDGPLVTTADDLERFLFALFRDGKLLKPATLARMTAPSKLEAEYGLGVELGHDRWGDWYGHSGLEDGFEAETRYYPGRKAVLVVMVNGNTESEKSILDRAAAALFRATSGDTRK